VLRSLENEGLMHYGGIERLVEEAESVLTPGGKEKRMNVWVKVHYRDS
jgi:hypothetical protein